MLQLTLRQLLVFESTARNLSFSRAAEEMHLTQPGVSTQLKNLEERIGMPLFEQMGRRIFLTEAGREEAAGVHESAPWGAAGPAAGFGSLPKAGIELAQAAAQVGRTGTPDQVQQAVAVLEEARRRMYSILAQG